MKAKSWPKKNSLMDTTTWGPTWFFSFSFFFAKIAGGRNASHQTQTGISNAPTTGNINIVIQSTTLVGNKMMMNPVREKNCPFMYMCRSLFDRALYF